MLWSGTLDKRALLFTPSLLSGSSCWVTTAQHWPCHCSPEGSRCLRITVPASSTLLARPPCGLRLTNPYMLIWFLSLPFGTISSALFVLQKPSQRTFNVSFSKKPFLTSLSEQGIWPLIYFIVCLFMSWGNEYAMLILVSFQDLAERRAGITITCRCKVT